MSSCVLLGHCVTRHFLFVLLMNGMLFLKMVTVDFHSKHILWKAIATGYQHFSKYLLKSTSVNGGGNFSFGRIMPLTYSNIKILML